MNTKLNFFDFSALVFLSAIWGSSFLFIKISVETISPSLLTFFRLFIASIFLVIYMKFFANQKIFVVDHSKHLIFIAIFGNLVPFNLISLSQLHLDSAFVAILIGCMPLFTCIISHFSMSGEKMNFFTVIGLVIGFAGVLKLFGISFDHINDNRNIYGCLILFSAFCYALSANCVKKITRLSYAQVATSSTLYATFLSMFTFLIISKSQEADLLKEISSISTNSFLAALFLGIVCTALAIIIFFYLIKRQSAVFASQSNFFIPCFGVFWSYLFLNEEINENLIYSAFFIVSGLLLVNKGRKSLKN